MALHPQFHNVNDPNELVRMLWDSSSQNDIAKGYIVGVIDALRWSLAITADQYKALYDKYVIPHDPTFDLSRLE